MKRFKILQFSIDFSTNFFNIFATFFGGSAPRTPYKSRNPKISKFPLNFRENLEKILKNFQKIAKFP